MKKILIVLLGLMLLSSYGCSNDEAKKSAEKNEQTTTSTMDTVSEIKEQAAEMGTEAAEATNETVAAIKEKTEEMADKAAKAAKKKPVLEGC